MTVASAGTGAPLVVNGLISGITTPKVIDALLEGYQAPITSLTNKQETLESQASDYRTLATDFQAVQNAAGQLNTTSLWDLSTATTSDSSVATAAASAGAQTGSLSFTVEQLAQANVLASSSGVSSAGQVVVSSPSLLVATGAAGIGFSALAAGSGLGIGTYAIKVTQASSSATVTGSTALAPTVTVGPGNDTITLTVDGAARTLTLAAGSYTPAGLASAVDSAAEAAGVSVDASVTSTGALRIATGEQGSAASIALTGGTALATLGLAAGQSARGSDAVVTVGGTTTTITSIAAGQQITVAAPGTATLTATVATAPDGAGALIGAGTAHAANVSTGNGSLSQVVAAINGSGLGATASAVKLETGSYILQVSANETGASGSVTVDASAFTGSPLGALRTIASAQTATVSVGGADGYTLSSSTDTFSNLLPGTSVTATSTGQATVTVSADAAGEATRVAALVTAANRALADIQKYAGYTTATKTGGPLMGSAVVTDLKQQILSIFGSVAGASSLGDAATVGITLTKTGTIDFTQQKFIDAFTATPSQVTALFTQDSTFKPQASADAGAVSLAFAGTDTAPGTYAVRITHSATQAVDTGATLAAGAVTAAETLTVGMEGATATYTTSAGESLSAVASGLNQAFASAGLGLTADVVGGTKLAITSNAYGSSAAFSVTSSAAGTGTTGLGAATAGTAKTVAGTDVAGTIGGVVATGNGQVLTASSGAPLDGLGLLVTAAGITSTTLIGTLTYRPGIAQQLDTAMNGATNPATGSMTTAVKSLATEASGYNSQIDMYEHLESTQRAVLQKEFDTMETNLGTLKNESSMLSSELASLPGL